MSDVSFIQDVAVPLFISVLSLVVEYSFFQVKENKETTNFSLFFKFILSVIAAFASFFSLYNLGIYYDLIDKESKNLENNSLLLAILIIISIIIIPPLTITVFLHPITKRNEIRHIKDFLENFNISLGNKVLIEFRDNDKDTINIPVSVANNMLNDISIFITNIISSLIWLIHSIIILVLWSIIITYTGSLPLSSEAKSLFNSSSTSITSNIYNHQTNYGIAFVSIMLLCIISAVTYSRLSSYQLKTLVDWILRAVVLRVFIEIIDDQDPPNEEMLQEHNDTKDEGNL